MRKVVRMTSQRLRPSIPTWYEIPKAGSHARWASNCMPGSGLKPRTSTREIANRSVVTVRATTFCARTAARGRRATTTAAATGRKTRTVSRLGEYLIAPRAGR